MAAGIRKRHSKGCSAHGGGRCNCGAGYEAQITVRVDGAFKKVRKTFPTLAAAKSWRADVLSARSRGQLLQPSKIRVREEAADWLALAKAGEIRERSGRAYKPSTLRSYEEAMRNWILSSCLADLRLSDVRRADVQDFADHLLAAGLSPSSVRNVLNPLQAIFRRAVRRERVAVNPTLDIDLPTGAVKRDRIAAAGEATRLLDSLPTGERALWATAFYAGLRRGELQALRWSDVDLGGSVLRVERGWDQEAGEVEPKSASGRRTLPILAVLHDHLIEHKLATGRDGEQLVFGRTVGAPFVPSTVRTRARKAWAAGELKPICLHEARHTFASLLIDSGANPKAIQEFMGHSTITMTFDRYGHLMPGRRDEIRERMDAYLARSADAERAHEPANGAKPSECATGPSGGS